MNVDQKSNKIDQNKLKNAIDTTNFKSLQNIENEGKFGESKASNPSACIFFDLFPRNSLLLKNRVTSFIGYLAARYKEVNKLI